MFEMNVLSLHIQNKAWSYCTHTHRQLSVSHFPSKHGILCSHDAQSTCNMYVLSQMVYSFSPVFCYVLFHSVIKWILWICDGFSQRRINTHWLLTPVTSFVLFFVFLRQSLCVETAFVLVVNGVYWQVAFWCCCWLCVQFRPSPERSIWLEDSGGSWS